MLTTLFTIVVLDVSPIWLNWVEFAVESGKVHTSIVFPAALVVWSDFLFAKSDCCDKIWKAQQLATGLDEKSSLGGARSATAGSLDCLVQ